VNEASFTERIQLAVTPRLAFRSNQVRRPVNFQELRTVVTVKLGEWVDLAGPWNRATRSTARFSAPTETQASEDSRFLIRVDSL